MRKRRNWLKSTVAMIVLVATVLNTGFSTAAADLALGGDIEVENTIAEDTSSADDISIEVVSDSSEDVSEEDISSEDEEVSDDEDMDVESSEDSKVSTGDKTEKEELSEDSSVEADDEDESSDTDAESEEESDDADADKVDEAETDESDDAETDADEDNELAKELKDGEINITSDQIEGSGYDDIKIYVNTEGLSNKDKFRVKFSGPESATYNPIINDDLDKTVDGYLMFEELDKEMFSISANSTDDVEFKYSINKEGYPMITAVSVLANKNIKITSVTSEDGKEESAINAEGYECFEISFDTEEISESAEYKLYVSTDADATIDDKSVSGGVSGFGKDSEPVMVENLDGEEFTAYIISENELELETEVVIDSFDDGKATIVIKEIAVKTVYEYEDDKVFVRAVLEKADAIPDSAYFSVTPIKDTQKYLDIMNESVSEGEEVVEEYTDDNTLVYDVAFYTDETKKEEIEPEEGSVSISIEFKKKQLSDDLGAKEDEEVEIVHFEENGNEIEPVVVEAEVSTDSEVVEFALDSFSTVLVHTKGVIDIKPGTEETVDTILGAAVAHGLVANDITLTGHLETNMAAGALHGYGPWAAPNNDGGGAGVSYVGAYDGTDLKIDMNGNSGQMLVYTTPKAVRNFGFNATHVNPSDWDAPGASIPPKGFSMDKNIILDMLSKSEGDIKSYVADMVKDVANTSDVLFARGEVEGYNYANVVEKVNGKNVIDIAKYSTSDSGTYYINFAEGEFANASRNKGELIIKLKPSQNVVFNIPDKSVGFQGYDAFIGDERIESNGYKAVLEEKIVFNCPNATTAKSVGPTDGTFLVPRATYSNDSVAAGWLVANVIAKVGGQEWHCKSKTIPVIETNKASYDFEITKTYSGATNWPAGGFSFKIESYPGDSNNTGVDPNPPMPNSANITITGDTVNHTASFGSVTFDAETIYKSGYPSGQYQAAGRDVKCKCFMYKITEVIPADADKIKGVNYDTKPWYLKLWVNAEKVNNTYTIWIEPKTARSVEDGTICQPGAEQPVVFENTFVENAKIKLEGQKTINGQPATRDEDNLFTFKLYYYLGNDNWASEPAFTAKNTGDHFEFPEMEFDFTKATGYNTASGRYDDSATKAYFYYKITEEQCNRPFIYDKTAYIAKVIVTKGDAGYTSSVKYFKFEDPSTLSCKNYAQKDMGSTAELVFNNTYEAKIKVPLTATKELLGRSITAADKDKFTFILKDGNGALLQSKKNSSDDGTLVTFDELEFNQDKTGEHVYFIYEASSSDDNITITDEKYKVIINIIDNKNGTLSYTKTLLYQAPNTKEYKEYKGEVPKFTNTYNAEGAVTFRVSKVFSDSVPSGAKFNFHLGGEANEDSEFLTSNGSVSFGTINYTLNDVGEHTYTISENHPAEAELQDDGSYLYDGIKYDGTVYNVKVVVADAGDGTLNITKTIDGTPVEGDLVANFENDYKVIPTKDTISGTKVLTGKVLDAGQFTFAIEPISDDAKSESCVIVDDTVTNAKNGAFEFKDIEFKKAGTYSFRISEVIPTDATTPEGSNKKVLDGITYDQSVFEVEIKVSDDGKGHLVIKQGDKKITGAGAIEFTNIYNAEGETTIVAKKTLTGRTLENNQFEFELVDSEGDNAKVLQSAKNNAEGTITFSTPLKYTLSDLKNDDGSYEESKTFTYYVREKNAGVNGYVYDSSYKKVVVTVTNKGDGSLEVSSSFEDNDDTFENTYSAKGDITFGGTKKMSGRKFEGYDDKFVAVLYDENGDAVRKADIVKNSSIFGDKGGSFTFDPIEYDAPGEYTYTVKEEDKDPNAKAVNVTNDDIVYTVVVTVSEIADKPGELATALRITNNKNSSVSTSLTEGIAFNNTYEAEGSTHFKAYKSLTGGTLAEDAFSFELTDSEGKNVDTKKNNGAGEVTFKTIGYTQNDLGEADSKEFVYYISEKNDNKAFYEYDGAVYAVKVTVTNNGGESLVVSDPEYYNVAVAADGTKTIGTKVTQVEFKNSYTAKGEVELYANKTLTGRALEAEAFEFVLLDQNNKEIQRVSNTADKSRNIKFETIEYTQADLEDSQLIDSQTNTYAKYYKVKEVNAEAAGYKYDDTIYNVIVTLRDNGRGEIITDWFAFEEGTVAQSESFWDRVKEVFGGTNKTKDIKFENEYTAVGEINFSAIKALTGAVLNADDFEFTLTGNGQNQVKPNAEDGTVAFDKISYTQADAGKTYTYTVKETKGTKPGYTYDSNEYEVVVKVEDPGTGVLSVTATVNGVETKSIDTEVAVEEGKTQHVGVCTVAPFAFENSYRTEPVSVVISGDKEVSGRKNTNELPLDEEFSFMMVSDEDNSKSYSETVKNNALGVFTFPAIEYTFDDLAVKNADNKVTGYDESRSFAYTVSEIKGENPVIDYSTAVKKVVVTIKDNGNGTLSKEVKVDNVIDGDIKFINPYKAEGELTLRAHKDVLGSNTNGKQFTFKVTGDELANPLTATAVNKGEAVFAPIKYTLAMLNGEAEREFHYVMEEVEPDNAATDYKGYEFSKEKYDIVVTVSNAANDGKLTVSYVVTGGETEDGKVRVNEEETCDNVVFTNVYTATGELPLSGDKTLTGRTLKAGEFAFELYQVNDDGTETLIKSAQNDVNGKFSFVTTTDDNKEIPVIQYTQDDIDETFNYKVVEVEPENKITGVTYSEEVYAVEAKVSDNGDGTLKVDKTITKAGKEVTGINFLNVYKDNATVTFGATKSFEGKPLTENMFNFVVEKSKGGDIKVKSEDGLGGNISFPLTASNTADGKVIFDSITFDETEVGEYEFTIKEVNDGKYGITYTKDVYKVNVNVYVNDAGKLVADKVITKVPDKGSSVEDISEDEVVFKNTFEDSTSLKFEGEKSLVGFKSDKVKKGAYTFVLKYANGETIEEVPVRGGGKYSFKELTYDQTMVESSPFEYTVSEVLPEGGVQENIHFDDNVYTIKVELSYDAEGKLVATPTVEAKKASENSNIDIKSLNFTNEYKAENEWIPKATKSITGKMLEDKAYSFNITETDENWNALTGDAAYSKTVVNSSYNVTFDKITYNQDSIGEHYYVITETESRDGSSIDNTIYHVTVDVSVDDSNNITVNDTYVKIVAGKEPETVKTVEFTNTYKAKGSITLDGNKIMLNKDLAEGDYTFELLNADGSVVTNSDGVKMVATNGNAERVFDANDKEAPNGKATSAFTFPVLKFTQEDFATGVDTYANTKEYVYTVKEKKAVADDSIEMSKAVYQVKLTLTLSKDKDEDGDYIINVEKVITNLTDSKDKNPSLSFTNKYDACGFWDPVGYKQLVGRDISDGEFTFQIKDVEANKTSTVTNKGHEIRFSHKEIEFLNYTLADLGEHTYEITELAGDSNGGITYAPETFTIKVNVTDAGNGKLEAEVVSISPEFTIEDETIEDANFVFSFKNTYKAEGSVNIVGTKKMLGRTLTDKDIFQFTITDDETGATKTVENTRDVEGKFSKIEFLAKNIDFLNYSTEDGKPGVGTHTYTIVENDSNVDGIIYDKTWYKVEVEVSYTDKQGNVVGVTIPKNFDTSTLSDTLKAEVTSITQYKDGTKEAVDSVIFENRFKAHGEVVFDGIKRLIDDGGNAVTDTSYVDGMFKFALYRYDNPERRNGELIGKIVTCNAKGEFTLGDAFTEAILANGASFDTEKTLYYRIVEVKEPNGSWNADHTVFESNGIAYDNAIYDIDVQITYNGTETLDVKKTSVVKKANEEASGTAYSDSKYAFTNTLHMYEIVSGRKIWNDSVTDAASRPDVTVYLYSSVSDKPINSYTIVAPENTYRFTTDAEGKKLPTFDSKGKKIKYRVEEAEIDGYLSEVVGTDIYNTAGSIKIQKLDSVSGQPVEGATLAIFDSSNAELERWTSAASAHIVMVPLKGGVEYTLRELEAPKGYEVADDVKFTVPKDGSDITVKMMDKPIVGAVHLVKRDADTREALAGAEFALYTSDGIRVYATGITGDYTYTSATSNGIFVTGSTGDLTVRNLPYGSYYFVETSAPAGYKLSSTRETFSVVTNGTTAEVTYLNSKATGSVRLTKTNAGGTRTLAGAVFELYSASPRTLGQAAASTLFSNAYYLYGTYRTNEYGELYVDELPWDDYYFVEIEAPSGYVINTDENGYLIAYTFTIDSTSTETLSLGRITNEAGGGDEGGDDRRATTTVVGRTVAAPRGVLGARAEKGGVVSGVLGVRAKPTSGVLGARVGPVTGDVSNIVLWSLMLVACIGTIVVLLLTGKKKEKKNQ